MSDDEAPIGTNYDKGEKPVGDGSYENFDRLLFWVGNPKQAAQWYCLLFGFEMFKYKGLETGSRNVVSYVIKQKKIIWEFATNLRPFKGGGLFFGHFVEYSKG